MNFCKKNIAALIKYQPGFDTIYHDVSRGIARNTIVESSLDDSTSSNEPAFDICGQVSAASARDGSTILYYEAEGKNWRLNSAYRPAAEAEKWAGQFEYSGIERRFLLFGLGNGSFLRSMLQKCSPDAKIYVYEPSLTIFFGAMEACDLKEIFEDERVCIGVGEAFGTSVYSWLDQYVTRENDKQLLLCIHPIYEQIFPEMLTKYKQERKALTDRLIAASNTKRAYGKSVVRNTLYNLHRFSKDERAFLLTDYRSERMENALREGVPVVIVSTGPSLSRSIEGLRKLSEQKKVLIFAVDSSLRYLLHRGIHPDYVVTIDPVKWPKHFSMEESHNIPMFLRFDSNDKIVEQQTGDLVYFGGVQYPGDLFASLGADVNQCFAEDTGGSVATAAFTVCLMLGFEKIVLVGQDLCYDGQYTHAGNVVSVDEKKQGFGKVWIPGNMQEQVLTRQDWLRYLRWFEQKIREYPKLEVWNATEGGARIAGTKRITLTDLYEELEKAGQMTSTIELDSVNLQQKESVHLTNSCISSDSKDTVIKCKHSEISASSLGEFTPRYLRQRLQMVLEEQEGTLREIEEDLERTGQSCTRLQELCQIENMTYQQLCQNSLYLESARQVQQFLAKLEMLPIASFLELLIPEDQESKVYELSGNPVFDELQTWIQLGEYFEQLRIASNELLGFMG